MATRLEVAHGLIAEPDRLSTSADTLSVTRPTTGSKTRSKGILFVLVNSAVPGPRAHEATRLVAETVRHEYYYDESAGIPVCLEKALRNAARRLLAGREAAGLAPGSLGVGLAVVRNNELYLATLGTVEAYLVRSARLLMPDGRTSPGLPAKDPPAVEVWRGELSVGDALILVSRSMTETVGTEELKSAVLTLHPQAAVEHLHHLFVAAGGEGSDAVIALEATEQTSRAGAPSPTAAAGAYGDLPGAMPGSAAGSMGMGLMHARDSLGGSLAGLRERLWEVMPRRHPSVRRISARVSQAESRRRAAIGLLALIVLVFGAGLLVMILPRGGSTLVDQVAGGDSALAVARDRVDRADNLTQSDPQQSLAYYREAWREVQAARGTGLSGSTLDDLEARVRTGLDAQYGARQPQTTAIQLFSGERDPRGLEKGPDGAAYLIDGDTVVRVDTTTGDAATVVTHGDKAAGGGSRIGRPVQIESGGPDLIIIDDAATAWRWRPSDDTGRGTLAKLNFIGGSEWGADHGDVEAFDDPNGYRLYVVEPSLNQILRYQPTFDRSSFSPPTDYLYAGSDEVSRIKELYIDFDLYALVEGGAAAENEVHKYESGRFNGLFTLARPPDGADLRPGFDWVAVTGTGTDAAGRLYLYDAKWDRIVAYDKTNGAYVAQWQPGPDTPPMADVRGMYVVRGKKKNDPDTLYWVTPDGLFRSALSTRAAATPAASGQPAPRGGGRDAEP